MKPKTVLMVALILGVAVLIFSTTAYLASGQSDQIVLNIAPQALAVGQSTSLNVQITAPSGAPVTGWQFDLSFDPATLQLNSVEEGSFFR
ncbi:MAG: cohesin domain-containing protein, partial [Anaerolineales bacterium]